VTKKKISKKRKPDIVRFSRFAALDFETADYGRDSACSVGIVIADKGNIVYKGHYLIRPPRKYFVFSYLHGITWKDVENKPSFGELWDTLSKQFDGMEFIAAHNASFDRGVLHECCARAGIVPPEMEFLCTMKLSRRMWNLRPTRLSDVCRHFNIPLMHHDAASDAHACAKIVLQAAEIGVPTGAFLKRVNRA
jgi:DNA polymerase-3 subunit epsilon